MVEGTNLNRGLGIALIVNVILLYTFPRPFFPPDCPKEQCTVEFDCVMPKPQRMANSVAIIVPFAEREIEKVIQNIKGEWTMKLPCMNRIDKTDVIFYSNFPIDEKTQQNVMVAFPDEVRRCFNRVRFLSANLTEEEEGYPDGPNNMFCKLMSNEEVFQYSYFFYFEPDARPIRPNWANAVFDQANPPEEFWIKGSTYLGNAATPESVKKERQRLFHVNGNAIYGVGDPRFRTYAKKICQKLFREGEEAYDYRFAIDWWDTHETWNRTRRIYHKVVYSKFIQNMAQSPYNLMEIIKSSPETYFIHGGRPWYWT